MSREFYIDVSDLSETIETMRRKMSGGAFDEMLRRTFNDAGKKVKTIMKNEIPKEYAVKPSWVGSMVGFPKRLDAGQIGVVVQIKGARGSIGGRFHATGGAFTRRAYTRKDGRKVRAARINRKIKAKIINDQSSIMPKQMAHQGGQPPFMAHGVAFTRVYKGQAKPIVHVVGLGVPQMPINRSEEDVRREIEDVIQKRMLHHFKVLMK